MESVWSDTAHIQEFDCLKEDKQTEVLIIGGGMAGILCAYFLKEAGIPCILAEADRLCSGITKNTTAKITSQHGLIYHKLLRRFGPEKTRMYLDANEAALKQYEKLCRRIDCDFEEKDSYVYCVENTAKLEKELAALERIGFAAGFSESLPLPFPAAGAVRFQRQAQFHPLKFVAGITEGLQIYEHTKVRGLIGTRAVTAHGSIEAQRIIVATHFPLLNKHGSYFIKMYQHRSYVTALRQAQQVDGMYVDASKKGLSFRNYGDLLLLGGGSHRTGKKGGCWQELADVQMKYYPESTEAYRFAAQDCMTLDDVPYIGRYSGSTTDLYVATGFNKWGMTSSMVSAMLLCDMLQGRQQPWAEVFSPSRSMLRPRLAINALESTVDMLTPTTKRCPHLGCALKWNAAERSWDCPCHGSRFTEEGQLLDNPATGDLKGF